jgi:hypothetical protein
MPALGKVPYFRCAFEVLRELRALSGGSPNIFPSPGKGDCMCSNTMLYALYRMGYHGRATTHGINGFAVRTAQLCALKII